MAQEIELKLALSPAAADQLVRLPWLGSDGGDRLHLLNTYFDTPGLDLHRQRVAVRFRKKHDAWLLTVKTAGSSQAGLSVRGEWETSRNLGDFDFSHVDDAPLRTFLEGLAPQLQAVFITNFERQLWRCPIGESLIELAVDRGEIKAHGLSEEICEVELELLSGRIEDIIEFSNRLKESIALEPATQSKAERGYALLG